MTTKRNLKRLVRLRMAETNENYTTALAWVLSQVDRPVRGPQPAPEPAERTEATTHGVQLTIDELQAKDRRLRAEAPCTRPAYSLTLDDREVNFGFGERLVMTPMRHQFEPDRMRVAAVELWSGIAGHVMVLKLIAGGYEVWNNTMDALFEASCSFEILEQRYGSRDRVPYDPAGLPSGLETSASHVTTSRLAKALLDRYRWADFADAVVASDPSINLFTFKKPRFEIIDARRRYARFSFPFAAVSGRSQHHEGIVRGEVDLPTDLSNEEAFARGLVLVDVRVVRQETTRTAQHQQNDGERARIDELELARERRRDRETMTWERMMSERGWIPPRLPFDEGPFVLEDLAEERVPPGHSILVKETDPEFGAYHSPIVVPTTQVGLRVGSGYRALTAAEVERMDPDPQDNFEDFGGGDYL